MCRDNLALLTPDLILAGDARFFNDMKHYPLSGIFVRFLIEMVGQENFLRAYGEESVPEALGLTDRALAELLRAFPAYVTKQFNTR
ncbi:MAG: hypothetical protein R2751_17470 [Bacteroidales bacterium]